MKKYYSAGITMLAALTLIAGSPRFCDDVPSLPNGSTEESLGVPLIPATESNWNRLMEVVFAPSFMKLKEQVGTEVTSNAHVNFDTVMKDALILSEFTARLHQWSEITKFETVKRKEGFLKLRPELAIEAVQRDAAAIYGAAKKKDFEVARRSFVSMASNCNICHQKMKKSWSPVVVNP